MAQLKVTNIYLHRFKRYKDKVFDLPEGFCLLAGGNNSGKSSFMQAFALWEFCKSIITIEKGDDAIYKNSKKSRQGVGINGEDFLPLNIPSLKHLWTNLKFNVEDEDDGYTLWIEVRWENLDSKEKRHLRFSLSLANERLFVRVTKSNVESGEVIPRAAYIPPFAGILNKEPYHTKAMRSRLIGQGLSGSVMRNTLLDLYKENIKERARIKGDRQRILASDLTRLRSKDRWEHLLEITRRLFNIELIVQDFNEDFNSYINVEYWKGEYNDRRTKFEKYNKFNRRDIMVEGSGFLQMLNVLSLSVDPGYNIVFLDEPDAHLHPTLQFELMNELEVLSDKYKKQIFFATHSTELIASRTPNEIMKFENGRAKLLTEESQKIALITGLGVEFSPLLHRLQRTRKIVFVESDSDENTLKIIAKSIGKTIGDEVVFWPWTGKHSERLHLFNQLKRELGDIKGISLRDRDGQDFNSVSDDMFDKENSGCEKNGLKPLTWRYRYIESYLLCPKSISIATDKNVEDVLNDIRTWSGMDLSNISYDKIFPIIKNLETKEIVSEGNDSICNKYGISKYDIARNMIDDEVHVDIKNVIEKINTL
ncbi:AAA family ATPase [Vibrio fluvialis]|nr:AAA family ATPase [Vibrio fluvialis]